MVDGGVGWCRVVEGGGGWCRVMEGDGGACSKCCVRHLFKVLYKFQVMY